MKRVYILLIFSIFIQLTSFSQKHYFEIKNGEFLLDKKPFYIHAGEMHYARIPEQYWQQRLQMLKAMGLNTVSTYVFWNYHHPAPDVWDFKTGNHNLKKFIQLAQQEGLYVILRPGPYVCAEWDFGGFPWWFSIVKGMQVRTDNQQFLDSCKIYFKKLKEQIGGLHITEGGSIILTQVENEFGSYVAQQKNIAFEQHRKYTEKIKNLLEELKFKEPYFTADGDGLFNGGAIKNILPCANGEDNVDSLKARVGRYNNNEGPYFVSEFYPGWLDHWAEPFEKVATQDVMAQAEKYLKGNVSFNFYMVHGGTNFGYTAGANANREHPIQPDITSYDYDAPISEAGWATGKYKTLRELMKSYTGNNLPDIPKPAPVITLPDIQFDKTINFFSWVNTQKPVMGKLKSFEELGVANGYVLYRKKIEQPLKGKLNISGLRDFATVYINGNKIGELNRYYKKFEMDINIPANATLDILVESMGRINYGIEISANLKGIISPVLINDKELSGNWQMFKIPLAQEPALKNYKTGGIKDGSPVLYSASFTLNETGDTFLNMQNFSKGIVFVNGHHLGRYWNAGPQQTLYLPGCWLKKGTNEIIVFDQVNKNLNKRISSLPLPVLDKLK